jgi:hypothetical protein
MNNTIWRVAPKNKVYCGTQSLCHKNCAVGITSLGTDSITRAVSATWHRMTEDVAHWLSGDGLGHGDWINYEDPGIPRSKGRSTTMQNWRHRQSRHSLKGPHVMVSTSRASEWMEASGSAAADVGEPRKKRHGSLMQTSALHGELGHCRRTSQLIPAASPTRKFSTLLPICCCCCCCNSPTGESRSKTG